MSAETDWSGVSDAAHRDWVDSERNEKLEELEAEVIRLRTELNAATKASLDAIATICEKEREADALRVDAERWRYVCERMEVENDDDEHGFWCSTVALKSGVIYPPPSPYYETVNQAIDAAMGEGK